MLNGRDSLLAEKKETMTFLCPISFDEICVSAIFIITVLLWILPLNTIPIFKKYGPGFIKEATPTFLS